MRIQGLLCSLPSHYLFDTIQYVFTFVNTYFKLFQKSLRILEFVARTRTAMIV